MSNGNGTQTKNDLKTQLEPPPHGQAAIAVRAPDGVSADEFDTLFGEEPPEGGSAPGLDSITRSEIDVQISTAKKYPRNVRKALAQARTMATLDEDTAISCFYALPRGGKKIEGPSVRLAEIMACTWGNLRYGSRIIDEGDKFITALGMCHDLESNTALGAEVRRRITNKKGERFDDDMIGVTGMAAQSIALRNAILRIVPRVYTNSIMQECKRVAIGDQKPMAERRTGALERFAKMGISAERVIAKLNEPGIGLGAVASADDITTGHIEFLVGLYTALRENQTTIDEQFPTGAKAEEKGASGLKAAAARAAAKAQETKKAVPVATTTAPAPAEASTVPHNAQTGEVEQSAGDEMAELLPKISQPPEMGAWFLRLKEMKAEARVTEVEHKTLLALGEAREKQILAKK